MITVLSGIAEFEADMIKERQLEGIELTEQRGVYKGRPHKYTDKHKGMCSLLHNGTNGGKGRFSDHVEILKSFFVNHFRNGVNKGYLIKFIDQQITGIIEYQN